jgi:hypothetical protein
VESEWAGWSQVILVRWIDGVASFDFAQDEALFFMPSKINLMLSEVEARTAFMPRL